STADTDTITSTTFDSSGTFNLLTYSGVDELNPRTGLAADTVNILSTSATMYLNSAGGADIVNIGNSTNGVQSINAPIEVDNSPSFSVVNIDDSADTAARSPFAQTQGAYGIIAALAPFVISYKYADVSAVNVTLG